MIDAIIAILLQAAPQEAAQASQVAAPAAVEKKAALKIICRREYEVGSRVKRIKVCHAVGEPEEQEDKTALQRALDKRGDFIDPQRNSGQ
jgi:hypothetical protein